MSVGSVVMLFGCDPAATSGSPDEAAAAVELGQMGSDRQFVPYRGGETVEIVQGLQGGFHVFVDGRLIREPAERVEYLLTLDLVRPDDGADVTSVEHLRVPNLRTDKEGYSTFDDLVIFIPEPEELYGYDVRIDAAIDVIDGGWNDARSTSSICVRLEGRRE